MLPKITIITPSFNQAQYLEQTIDSVLSQNYPDLEYIIIDGGSTDQSVEIIKKYQEHVTYWVSEKDKGQSDAINKGLRIASGEIVNWLNSDDYYEKDALNKVGRAFQDKAIHVVCGQSRLFNQEGTVAFSKGTDVYTGNLAKTIGWARIDQPETFFRRSAVAKMGLLNPHFHYIMDKEWWVRYLMLFGLDNVLKIDEQLVNFRLHESSKTVSQALEFEKETLHFYYFLARKYDFTSVSSILEATYAEFFVESPKSELSSNLITGADQKLIRASLNYFLLYLTDYNYYIHKRERASQLLRHVTPSGLPQEDRKILQGLKRRMAWLPVWMVKYLRAWK